MGVAEEGYLSRTGLGRVLVLAASCVGALVGTLIGVWYYRSLVRGPFVNPGIRFESTGFLAVNCYNSVDASRVLDHADRMVVVLPAVVAALVACGLVFTARRGGPVVRSTVRPPQARLDGLLAGAVSMMLAAPAAGVAHGFNIRRLLDPGCVDAAVPAPATAVAVEVGCVVGALMLGRVLERNGQNRRSYRAWQRQLSERRVRPAGSDGSVGGVEGATDVDTDADTDAGVDVDADVDADVEGGAEVERPPVRW